MNAAHVIYDILALLTAAVIAIPLFHRLGLGSVLGYLAAGIVLGPWGFSFIVDVAEIRHFAEFGVVFLLFLIGIEMKPSRLWIMRHWVFGLGLAQVTVTGVILSGLANLLGLPLTTAIIVGFGLALSSTAFGLQILSEKGELASVTGRMAFSVLLLQDLAVIPLLTLIPILSEGFSTSDSIKNSLTEASLAIVAVILFGRYLLNPLLDRVAACRNSEVFIAAAVLLVLGVAKLMEMVGISMALGAFLAGFMLAESHYRHQIEADIQPFRGILLGLFFMTVGMSINFGLLISQAPLVLSLFIILLLIKFITLLVLCRISGLDKLHSIRISVLLSQAGEFGFVLFGYATLSGLMDTFLFELLTLLISMTMATTPFLVYGVEFWIKRYEWGKHDRTEIFEIPEENMNHVILAGFGRVGQRIATLMNVARIPYLALDNDHEQVLDGRDRGYPVYFGDARRIEVLKAAGAERARMLLVSLDNADYANQLVSQARQHFPFLPIHARAKDREHCDELLSKGANSVVSETLEASLRLGNLILKDHGFSQKRRARLLNDCRQNYYSWIKKISRNEKIDN